MDLYKLQIKVDIIKSQNEEMEVAYNFDGFSRFDIRITH